MSFEIKMLTIIIFSIKIQKICFQLRKENVLNTDSTPHTDSTSFKDMLAQFAKLSQAERQEILHNAVKPPPPYPEVTVHPVPTTSASNSLLHGILTKV